MTVDYTIFYKDSYIPDEGWADAFSWDVFVSAYNTTDRVRRVFDDVRAERKVWVVHSEYAFTEDEAPTSGTVFAPEGTKREDDFVQGLIQQVGELDGAKLCLDISGFMRPHLLFLVRLLAAKRIRAFDAVYSEPGQYVRRELTEFAQGKVVEVRPVAGYEGVHQPSIANDDSLLIIGAGYEHDLMRDVANSKTNTRKLQLLGFPPLQADFYQENVLNANRAAEAVAAMNEQHPLFAPANDPFVTASVLRDAIEEQRRRGVKNVYLCPLSSRPQALGFALYYLFEAQEEAVSIIYPFANRYSRATAAGISRVWKYHIELP